MKINKFLRFTFLFVSITLIISLFGACSQKSQTTKEQTNAGNSGTATKTNEQNDDGKEDYILSVCTMDRYAQWSQNDMRDIFQAIQNDSGIKFKFECVANDQYQNVMSVRLASNEKLPDLLVLPGTQNDVLKYYNEGLVISLKDLINKHAPNIKKYFEENPNYRASHYTPEGEIPVLYADTREYHNFAPYWPWVRVGFLENLNIKMPETIDEFYNMLVKFKSEDANGNGDLKDEIPFSCQNWSHLLKICEFFNARTVGDGFNQDDNGKVQYHFITKQFKEAITFLNKMYKEGLLDNEFSTMTSQKLRTKIANGTVAAFSGYAHGNPALIQAGITDDKFLYLPVLRSPNGDKLWIGSNGLGLYPLGITKDCKYPDLAIKWIDEYCFNRDNYTKYILGIEGKNYTMEDGKFKATDWAINHTEPNMENVIKTLGGTPAISYPYDIESWKIIFEYNAKAGTQHKDENSVATENLKYVKDPFPFVYSDSNDIEVISRYMNDINTYRDEMIIKFILGEERLDNFDIYVNTLNDMGVKEILEIKQKQYDQYIKNLKN